MAFEIQIQLNGQNAGTPFNLEDLEIELLFDKDAPQARVTNQQWIFVNEDAKLILDHINSGKIFQGIDLNIKLVQDGVSRDFRRLLDFTQDHQLSSNKVVATAIDAGGIDWMNTNIDSFTFEYLYRKSGVITKDDFVFVPYVRNRKNNAVDGFILFSQIFYIEIELLSLVTESSSDVGQSATVIDVPEIFELIAKIVYGTLLFARLIKLFIDLFDLIIQPVKYHAGMYVRDLFIKGCEHLGLEFESPILTDKESPYYDLFHLPKKYFTPETLNEKIFGFLNPDRNEQNGVYQGTFGDMVRQYSELFNAKIIVADGVMTFIRRDEPVSDGPEYRIPSVEIEESKKNSDELRSTYVLEYDTDPTDVNTYEEYHGTITEVKTVIPDGAIIDKSRLVGGGAEVRATGLAHGRQKKKLNRNEEIFNQIIKVANPLIQLFRGIANGGIAAINFLANSVEKLNKVFAFVGLTGIKIEFPDIEPIPTFNVHEIIDKRIGMLMLEADVVSVPKAFILEDKGGGDPKGYRIHPSNDTIMSSETIFKAYHQIELFADVGTETPNQWVRYKAPLVKFCFDDFLKVYRNSLILDENGDEARIESLKWKPMKQTASIDYRVREFYATEFTQEINTPDGK